MRRDNGHWTLSARSLGIHGVATSYISTNCQKLALINKKRIKPIQNVSSVQSGFKCDSPARGAGLETVRGAGFDMPVGLRLTPRPSGSPPRAAKGSYSLPS